ncbi:head-to-tail connector protein [Gordonia phage Eyre]|uniref:Head-to-tail connector protein n=1 Tax=Gordonia phage Eyre TaxID=1887646 RepID=A0A1B3AZT7_9CAUD|nr:head-tail connector protein [Gordonia phage Eyre]AOE44287.1 head-to-tail connector protein [Gordonia phage Eyre]
MSVVRAREAFAYTDTHGIPRVVRPGDLFNADDPSVVARANLFEPVEVAAYRAEQAVGPNPTPNIEAATAAPGEKRSVSTSRSKSKATSTADAKAAADATAQAKADADAQKGTGGA